MAYSLQSVALEGPREHGGHRSFSVLFLLFVFSPCCLLLLWAMDLKAERALESPNRLVEAYKACAQL